MLLLQSGGVRAVLRSQSFLNSELNRDLRVRETQLSARDAFGKRNWELSWESEVEKAYYGNCAVLYCCYHW